MQRLLALLLALCAPLPAFAESGEEMIPLPSGTTVTSQRYGTAGEVVVLWMTGQYGRIEQEHEAAARLAKQGMEVWVTDWLGPYFLPQVTASIDAVPEQDLADWLEVMRLRHGGRPLVLLASGHAVAWPLRAAAVWRERRCEDAIPTLAGAVLLWPLLYRDLQPGEEPEYDPVVGKTRLPLALLIPMSSAGYWWRERMQAAFEAAGSRVWLTVLPGLRDRFYHRDDATAEEQAAGERLADLLAPAIRKLHQEKTP